MTYDPVGVDCEVEIVRTLEIGGTPDNGLKEQVAPTGTPLPQDRLTTPAGSVISMLLIEVDAVDP